MKDIDVFIELAEGQEATWVGTMRLIVARGKERTSFEYAKEWLKHPRRFALEPDLQLAAGPQFPPGDKPIFNAFSDSAPDRWGRYLVVRQEKYLAEKENRQKRQMFETDFLLGIHDTVRMGALRLCEKRAGKPGPYLADGPAAVPPLIELRKLQSAVARVDAHQETDEDLAIVFAPGSSLGGARPKAVVREPDGRTMVAKFERDNDHYPVIRWEALMLQLAEKAGIAVPPHRLVEEGGKAILLMERFDRAGELRVPFISALTMVGASDGDQRSYLDIGDGISQYGGRPNDDLRQLWRRVVFNILVSNTDDHLRNHGFLHGPGGWSLSPAYDMNPVPADVGPRVLSLAVDEQGDRTASLALAIETAGYYGIDDDEAKRISHEVATAVSQWRALAGQFGLSAADQAYMESAFEHADKELALGD